MISGKIRLKVDLLGGILGTNCNHMVLKIHFATFLDIDDDYMTLDCRRDSIEFQLLSRF